MEDFDAEIEWAMTKGIDPDEHIKNLLARNDLPHAEDLDPLQQLLASAYSVYLIHCER